MREAFETNWLSTVGPHLFALEQAFTKLMGLPSVALGSGTAGLHLALRLAGVGVGDEVVAPTLTFVASANPILYLGARPVFIDSERTTWNLDPTLLKGFLAARARENRLPKAVIAVHLFGQAAAIDEIGDLCRRHGVVLIEDAAESLGSQHRGCHPGTFGDVGVFSFNGNKMITGTSGGMLVSRHADWVEKARHWSTQARDPDPDGLHNYVHTEVGYNYRMSNVVAGIVLGQLEVLAERVVLRRGVFERYCRALADVPGLEPQPEPVGSAGVGSLHSRWLSCFLVDPVRFGMGAADLVRWLDRDQIEARPVWKPMHLQPLFVGAECLGGSVAAELNRCGICIPSSSSLSSDDQWRVIQSIRRAAGRS